jgi:hypothetical protein
MTTRPSLSEITIATLLLHHSTGRDQSGRRKLITILGLGVFTAILLTWAGSYFWPDQTFPGIGVYSYIRLYDSPEYRQRYVFEFETSALARTAFYLSASDQFTFSVTDAYGSTYPIEVKVGQGGIPIDKFVALFCEVGLREDSTILRVSVNDQTIASRIVPARIELGTMDWHPGNIGAPITGQNVGGIFKLFEIGIYKRTFTSAEREKPFKNITDFIAAHPA